MAGSIKQNKPMILTLVSFLLPPLIDLINRKILDSDIRFWVSVLVCALVGTVIEFVMNGFVFIGADPLIEEMLKTFAMAQLSYKGVWEDHSLRRKLGLKATTAPKVDLPELPDIIYGKEG